MERKLIVNYTMPRRQSSGPSEKGLALCSQFEPFFSLKRVLSLVERLAYDIKRSAKTKLSSMSSFSFRQEDGWMIIFIQLVDLQRFMLCGCWRCGRRLYKSCGIDLSTLQHAAKQLAMYRDWSSTMRLFIEKICSTFRELDLDWSKLWRDILSGVLYAWRMIPSGVLYAWRIILSGVLHAWRMIPSGVLYAWRMIPSGVLYAWRMIPSGVLYAWRIILSGVLYAWRMIPSGVLYAWRIILSGVLYAWRMIPSSVLYAWRIILPGVLYALATVNSFSISHPYIAAGVLLCISAFTNPTILLASLRLMGVIALFIPVQLITWCYGFRNQGVVKDSFASRYQSNMPGGSVPRNSPFSTLQSYGATPSPPISVLVSLLSYTGAVFVLGREWGWWFQ
ncbi:uncharacterized protein EDB91DRAFT_346622 [Suillus paluster]|uniref:uncharacterized protein n=1 Tax=Suillus paluster TaxID=48578 RepID=UPI001B868E0F|nr:uncharacterized protein EDB91DRAFT_346622 [Suillus paluster]KAG1720270.1 hypothetical protein EDB91DRAFT_346622 [Suillus paluster]